MKTTQLRTGLYFKDDTGVYHFQPRADGGIRTSFGMLKRLCLKKDCLGVILWINDFPVPIFPNDTVESVGCRYSLLQMAKRDKGISVRGTTHSGLYAIKAYIGSNKKVRQEVNETLFAEWY